jgi:hypothetical protein
MRHWKFYAGFVFLLGGISTLYGLLQSEYPLFNRPLNEEGTFTLFFGVICWFILAAACWLDYREIASSKDSEQKKEGEGERV